MPNTLVHIGINGFLTKTFSRKANIFWIYLGCIIPDIPWILKKIFEIFVPYINGYDLQAFSIIQSSLFFCIIISLAVSAITKNYQLTFFTLFSGSVLHLLTDSIETKWANGVQLFAPFSWQILNFRIIWPEHFVIQFLGFLGLVFFVFNWKDFRNIKFYFTFTKIRLFISTILLLSYFLLPLLFFNDIYENDNHFLSTLKNKSERTGKFVELDRKLVEFNQNTKSYWITSFNNDLIELKSKYDLSGRKISIKGSFINNDLIEVTEYHQNANLIRDGASYFALLLMLVFGVKTFYVKKIKKV